MPHPVPGSTVLVRYHHHPQYEAVIAPATVVRAEPECAAVLNVQTGDPAEPVRVVALWEAQEGSVGWFWPDLPSGGVVESRTYIVGEGY